MQTGRTEKAPFKGWKVKVNMAIGWFVIAAIISGMAKRTTDRILLQCRGVLTNKKQCEPGEGEGNIEIVEI